MMLWILLALLLQDPPKPSPEPPPQDNKEQAKKPVAADPDAPRGLKDEDESAENDVKEYTLDPAKAKHEIEAGNVYMHRGSYNAAAHRYEEATRWQPKNAQAYLKLGQALEKKDDPVRAAQAYRKCMELAPGDKQSKELQKKIEKLEKEAEK
jgi:Flp pilus assembly protein TadD